MSVWWSRNISENSFNSIHPDTRVCNTGRVLFGRLCCSAEVSSLIAIQSSVWQLSVNVESWPLRSSLTLLFLMVRVIKSGGLTLYPRQRNDFRRRGLCFFVLKGKQSYINNQYRNSGPCIQEVLMGPPRIPPTSPLGRDVDGGFIHMGPPSALGSPTAV